jgi:SAM-dependent methyltransferase
MLNTAQMSKWLRNRARMRRWPKLSRNTGSYYQAVSSLTELKCFFDQSLSTQTSETEYDGGINGRCYVCDDEKYFLIRDHGDGGGVNLRESVICPDCGLTNRWRSSLHIFEQQVRPEADDQIYITEAITPLYQCLVSRYPDTFGSEYFSGESSGSMVETAIGPVRNEDVTNLSFSDRSLHAVLSFDVLEHVPDYRAALWEFYRVLATGGQLILSAPFLFADKTRIMARVDSAGEIEHLTEPVYHGDPLSDEGVLCFQEFGMDLLDDMRQAGFQESFLLAFESPEWAYLEPQVMFIGRKRS